MPIGKKLIFKDPAKLAAALKREADLIFPLFVKQIQAGIAYTVYDLIIRYNPVDTGRSRESWRVTISAPSTVAVDPEQEIQQPGYWHETTGAPMTDGERAKILPTLQTVLSQPLGRTIYLTNLTKYIEVLEDGWSMKAPVGMVDISIQQTFGQGYLTRITALANEEVSRITGT